MSASTKPTTSPATASAVFTDAATGGSDSPPKVDQTSLAELRRQLGITTGESKVIDPYGLKRIPAREKTPPPTLASFNTAQTFTPDHLTVWHPEGDHLSGDDDVHDEELSGPIERKQRRRKKRGPKGKHAATASGESGVNITPEDLAYLDEIKSTYPEQASQLNDNEGQANDEPEMTGTTADPTTRHQKRSIPRRTRQHLPEVRAGSYLNPSNTHVDEIKAFHQECVATDFYAAVKSETQLFAALKSLMPPGSQNANWAKMSSDVKLDFKAIEAFAYHINDKYAKLLKTVSEARTWGDANGLPWGWVAITCQGAPPQEPDGQTKAKSDCPVYGGQGSAKAVCEHQFSKLTHNLKWFRQQYDESIVHATSRSSPPPISSIPRYKYDSYVSAAKAVHARKVATATYDLISADIALCSESRRLNPSSTSMPDAEWCEAVRSDSHAEKKPQDFFEDKEPKLASTYKAAHGWGLHHGLPVRSFVFKICGSGQSTSIPDTCPTKSAKNRTAEAVCEHQLSNVSSRVNKLRPLWKRYTADTKAVGETVAQAPISDDREPADTAGTEEPSTAATYPTDA